MKNKHKYFSSVLSLVLAVLMLMPGVSVSADTFSTEITADMTDEITVSAYDSVKTGQYYLKNASTGTYMTVESGKAANGQNVSVAAKKQNNAFRFNITGKESSGYYITSAINSSFAVNPYSDKPANGTNITLYKKNSDGTQLSYFEKVSGGYCIRSKYNTKLAFEVSGTNVKLATYSGKKAQIWTLEAVDVPGENGYVEQKAGYYFLKNVSTGNYLNFSKASNGQAAALSKKSNSKNFIFHLTGNAKNGYLLSSTLNESYVVNPYSDTPGNGTKITLYKKSGDGTQNWYFAKNGSGYTIHNSYADKCVITSGSTVTIATNKNTDAQTWVLEAAKDPNGGGGNDGIKDYKTNFTWGRDNWSFSNSSKYFTNGYAINTTIYNKLVSENKLSNSDKKKLKNGMKESWGGSCYGITMTELLAYSKKITLSNYGLNNKTASNKASSNATSLINFYQISQNFALNNQRFRKKRSSLPENQKKTLTSIYNHFKNNGEPLNLCYYFFGVDSKGKERAAFGHSVVCYGVVNCSDLNNGKGYYSNVTKKYYNAKLLIADPNYLDDGKLNDNACVFYNTSNGSWVIPYWTGTMANVNKTKCTLYCYWNSSSDYYGMIDFYDTYKTELNAETEDDEDIVVEHYLAGINLTETSNDDYNIDYVAETGNSQFNAGNGDNIVRMSRFADDISIEDDMTMSNEYALWNPTYNYNLAYDEPESYTLDMDYEKVAYFATAENARYTEFSPNGEYLIEGENVSYDIAMVTEDDVSVTDWYCMTVSGKDTNTVDISLADNGYILTADSLNNIKVMAENDEVAPELEFSTDATSVLIYEIDINTIGVAIDTDNDGTYETTIAPDSDEPSDDTRMGDVNDDGKINAADITKIAAHIKGLKSLDEDQKKRADVNSDGKINAVDITKIAAHIKGIKSLDTSVPDEPVYDSVTTDEEDAPDEVAS